jgi:hypothetical protein
MQAAGESGWSMVFGLPNRRSAHIFLELGWERIGTIRPWTFVLTPDERARAIRKREGRLAALALGLAASESKTGRVRLERLSGGLRAEPAEAFPEEVEALSKAVEPDFPFMVRRDAPYLNWRFVENPSGVHRVLTVRRPNPVPTASVTWSTCSRLTPTPVRLRSWAASTPWNGRGRAWSSPRPSTARGGTPACSRRASCAPSPRTI